MGLLNQSHVTDLLFACLHGELSPDERARVRAHLAECAACRRALTDAERLDARLRAEMPTLGRPHHGQLARLLPGVMARTRAPRLSALPMRRISPYGLVLTVSLLFAIILPFLAGSAPAAYDIATQPHPTLVAEAASPTLGAVSDTVTQTGTPLAAVTPVPTPDMGN